MKVDRFGQAKVLSPDEIQLLFNEGLQTVRDRCLFGVSLYTAARVNEACTLRRADAMDSKNRVRPKLVIRKKSTKGKLATREVPIGEDLRELLIAYAPPWYEYWLFPGKHGKGHINPMSASRVLRKALRKVGIEGASTHSLRRTALTIMHNNGVPLRTIQKISGHRSLATLESYLAVSEEQLLGAVATLSHVSYVNKLRLLDQHTAEEKETQFQEREK